MDNVSIDKIQSKKNEYEKYLNSRLNPQAFLFLNDLSFITDVLIFSGITRDFFLNKYLDIRDLDLVVYNYDERLDVFCRKFKYSLNSFGGYKIDIDGFQIDLWKLEDTWAIRNAKVPRQLFNDYLLPQTSFFNFSSIVYDYSKKNFIFSHDFLTFLSNKKIDLVLEDNPQPQLCIVNAIYYKNKLNLELAYNLKRYIVMNFDRYTKEDYRYIQIKHFKSQPFSYGELAVYYNMMKQDIEQKI